MTTKKEVFLKMLDKNMQSCNGGTYQWQLGKRVTVKGEIVMCTNGIHLTLHPQAWQGSRVFIAETNKVYDFQKDGFKAVCRSAKLLMELSPEQLEIYAEGEEPLSKAYEEGRAPLLKAYEEGEEPLLKAYEEGEEPLWKAYEEGRASLLKAYEEGRAPLLKAYKEGEAPLLKAYKEGKVSLWKAYKEKCQKIIVKILKKVKTK